jgi:phosphomannomutase/phosphoglucomutase
MNIFRAYDVRGVYGTQLTEEIMKDIGKALGTFARGKKILVGGDCRISTDSLKNSLVDGISSTGTDVLLVEEVTSFGLALHTGAETDIVAYVTASHSPTDWNGVKFYYSTGVALSNEENLKVRDIFISKKFVEGEGVVKNIPADVDGYISSMEERFRIDGKLKIVVDPGNGSTSLIMPKAFEAIGCDVVAIFNDYDGNFPNRKPDIKKEFLTELAKTVKETEADFGLAFDGDGDRLAVIGKDGRYLESEEIAFIIAKHMEGNKIVATVECSRILDDLGFEIVRIPVGHTYLTKASVDKSVIVGVEASGHMTIPHYSPFDDSGLIACKFCQIMAGKQLSEEVKSIPHYMRRRTNFECSDDKKFKVVDSLKENFEGDIDTMDGIRINFDDAWVLIRASNTGAKIRMTVEAKDEKRLVELENKYGPVLKEAVE